MSDYVLRSNHEGESQLVRAPDEIAARGGGVDAPTHDQIARRAYEIYCAGGCVKGRCVQNWQQAEREQRAQTAKVRR